MILPTELEGVPLAGLIKLWGSDVPAWADSKNYALSKLAYLIARDGPEGLSFLKKYARSSDVNERRWALYYLASNETVDDEIVSYLVEAFNSDELILKTTALVAASNCDRYPFNRGDVEKLKESPGDIAASAFIHLSRAYPDEADEILRTALGSPMAIVRVSACDEVGLGRIFSLKDDLRKLLNDPAFTVVNVAKNSLGLLEETSG